MQIILQLFAFFAENKHDLPKKCTFFEVFCKKIRLFQDKIVSLQAELGECPSFGKKTSIEIV